MQATHDPKILCIIFKYAFDKTLREAFQRLDLDSAPAGPVQEEDDYAGRLRVRALAGVRDLEGDEWYVDLVVSARCCEELEHNLNWQLKQQEPDGSWVNHVRCFAGGISRVFAERTFGKLNFEDSGWRVLDDFIEPRGTVPETEVQNFILKHCLLVNSEMWRRFIMHYQQWPFKFVALINDPTPAHEPSAVRARICQEALDCCRLCMGTACTELVNALAPFLRWCVRHGGRIAEDVLEFFGHFFSEFPFHTGDVEGQNSILKRMCWVARNLGFGRSSQRLNIKQHTPQLSYEEFLKWKPLATHGINKHTYPFDTERYLPQGTDPVSRVEPKDRAHCEHQAGPRYEDAKTISVELEKHLCLLDVMRLGDRFYICSGKHFAESTCGALVVGSWRPPLSWPDLSLPLNLDTLFGPRYLLRDKVEAVLDEAAAAVSTTTVLDHDGRCCEPADDGSSVEVSIAQVQFDLRTSPPIARAETVVNHRTLKDRVSASLAATIRERDAQRKAQKKQQQSEVAKQKRADKKKQNQAEKQAQKAQEAEEKTVF